MDHAKKIYSDIAVERFRQLEKWGTTMDDLHNPYDWVALIVKHAGKAIKLPGNREHFEKQMVRVGALVVAALEWSKRNKEMLDDDKAVI